VTPELGSRVNPGTLNSCDFGKPEFLVTRESRSTPCDSDNTGPSERLLETGFLGDTGNTDYWRMRETGVARDSIARISTLLLKSGFAGDSGKTEISG